jgi:hypothetical protein
MNHKKAGRLFALTLCVLACVIGVCRILAAQGGLMPSADRVRYQLIGDEPIAGPDGHSLVNGWSVLVFKDRTEERCYIAFKQGSAITALEASACSQ